MKKITVILAFVMLATCFAQGAEGIVPATGTTGAQAVAAVKVGPRANTADDPVDGVYVSPNGNDDTATGAIGSPYKSINAALDAAGAGATIILRGGTYREGINVRVREPNVTIKSAKGEWAVIDLSKYDPGHNEDSGVYFDVDSSGGKLQNVEVIGGWYAVCMETKWGWGGDDDFVAASNIIIEDCILHDSRYDVVKVKPNCDNITIRYNEIYNSGRAGVGTSGWEYGEFNAEGIDNVNGDKMSAHHNYIHDIGGNGVYAKGGAMDALVECNIIERIKGAGILVGFDTSPEYFDLAVNSQFYENINGTVRNNLIIDTGWEGIGLYGSKDAQVYNNTLVNVDNGPGKVHSAIYFGLTYQDWDDDAARPANINPTIRNNIVSQPSTFQMPMVEIRYADELGGLSALDGNPVMSSNCYHIVGKSAAFNDLRPRSLKKDMSLAEWQTHISGDGGSNVADPALGDDYMPANTQCAGMGISAPLVYDGDGADEQDLAQPGTPAMSNFVKAAAYSQGLFSDVNENLWYGINQQGVISKAYEYGLMKGKGVGTFMPADNMTIAEAIAVAARVNVIYNGGVELVEGTPWYKVYVDYAVEKNMIGADDFAEFSRPATKAEMAYIFSRSLAAVEFGKLNAVNALPDVFVGADAAGGGAVGAEGAEGTGAATPYADAIIMLYEAGVLAGGDAAGTFYPGNNISRAEAAAIISRVILPDTRTRDAVYG
ncbi:MAG: S-layer homology domain-containing protein [Oscillospiraceae bacterium]|nr:S-layer homology domain-containing protein [Oscillospiraceae bacterium]